MACGAGHEVVCGAALGRTGGVQVQGPQLCGPAMIPLGVDVLLDVSLDHVLLMEDVGALPY